MQLEGGTKENTGRAISSTIHWFCAKKTNLPHTYNRIRHPQKSQWLHKRKDAISHQFAGIYTNRTGFLFQQPLVLWPVDNNMLAKGKFWKNFPQHNSFWLSQFQQKQTSVHNIALDEHEKQCPTKTTTTTTTRSWLLPFFRLKRGKSKEKNQQIPGKKYYKDLSQGKYRRSRKWAQNDQAHPRDTMWVSARATLCHTSKQQHKVLTNSIQYAYSIVIPSNSSQNFLW